MMTEFGKIAKSTKESLTAIGQMFFGLQGIAAGLKTVFGGISGKAAEVENVAASLGVLMRNNVEADALTASLQRLATNGVIGFEDLHRAARPLANVFRSGDDIARYVGVFADIAAGSKVPVDTLARMVSRIGDMGKAEFTELANNGVPIFEMLSRVTGKSAAELLKMSAAGQITKEQLLAAFELMTQKGERFYQMNATLSNTTSGSWATLKASVDECLAVFGEPVNDAIRPMLQDLSAWLQEHKSELTESASMMVSIFQTVGQTASVIVTPLRLLFELSTATIGPLGGVFVTAAAGLSAYATVTGKGINSTLRLDRQLVLLRKQFRTVGANISATWQKLRSGPTMYQRAVAISMAGVNKVGAAACVGLRTAFSFTWASVTAMARAACMAIKAALVSTGIGLLVWGIGEAASAIWQLFSDSDDQKAKEAEAQRQENELLKLESNLQEVAAKRAQEKADAELRAAEALERQNEELAKNKDAMSEVYFASRNKQAQDFLNSLGPEARRLAMLSSAGVKDETALEKEIQELRRMDAPMREHVDRMRELLELQAALSKMKRDADKAAADAAKKEAEARQKAFQEYRARREAEHEAEWNKSATLAEKRAYLFGVGSPQMTAGPTTESQVRADMEALANEDPVKHASMIAGMEKWLDKVRDLNEAEAAEASARQSARNSARVSVVQASLASVGGGGASIRIGDKQFREAQQQTKLLTAIKDALTNGPQVKELLAVLA